MTNLTDEELARAVVCPPNKGATEAERMLSARTALNELLSRQYDWIMRVCIAEFRIEELAADCVQEILSRVAVSIRNFKGDSKFTTWCYVIVRRTIWDFRKRTKRRQLTESLVDDFSRIAVAPDTEPAITPQDAALQRERHAALWASLDSLPSKQREAVVLHYLEDLPVAEAAERIGCSVSSLKTHLFRARERLKTLLSREENGEVHDHG